MNLALTAAAKRCYRIAAEFRAETDPVKQADLFTSAADAVIAHKTVMSLAAAGVAQVELETLLTVWDAKHPAGTDHPDQRHLLNEIVHPETTEALYAWAEREAAK